MAEDRERFDALLEKLQIPAAMLPEVKPSSCIYGYTDAGVLGGNIPIAGAAASIARSTSAVW